MNSGTLYRRSAFTDNPKGGNPAGVWVGETLPAVNVMQRIAAEIGYSETAFVAPTIGQNQTIRYYSPEMEVPFCGHATIATGVVLGETEGDGTYRLATAVGEIPVAVLSRGGVREASLTSVEPMFTSATNTLICNIIRMELTNEQWNPIEPIILSSKQRKDPRGRKERDPPEVLNGILWILRTGAPWKDLPQRYPPYQTCHRRFQQRIKLGVFRRIAEGLAQDLYERGGIDIREAFIDGTFVPAKKRVLLSARQNAAKAPRSWPSQTLLVFLSPLN